MIPENGEGKDLNKKIAAARAIGLRDEMANQIKFINGIPEWRPPVNYKSQGEKDWAKFLALSPQQREAENERIRRLAPPWGSGGP